MEFLIELAAIKPILEVCSAPFVALTFELHVGKKKFDVLKKGDDVEIGIDGVL